MSDNKNWIRSFQVTQPVRHKKGFTVYKVVSKVFQRNFPEGMTTMTVWKRYSDFKKLHMDLHLIHSQLHLKGKFPSFPKATVFGRFDYEVVEARRKSALALLEFAALHSLLFTSKVFVKFFEDGYDVADLKDVDLSEDVNAQSFENCLVPERLWCEPLRPSDKENLPEEDRDGSASASSFDDSCTTAEPVTDADADSMKSAAVMSCASEILINGGSDTEIFRPNNSFSTLMKPELGTSTLSLEPSIHSAKSDEQIKFGPECESSAKTSSKVTTEMSISDAATVSVLPPQTAQDTELPLSPAQRPISVSASWTSLSSLDTSILSSPLHKSESSRDLLEDEGGATSRNLTSTKKPNGFGFFDFLPIFSKQKQTSAKNLENKLLNDSLSASYICEAAGHFTVAQQYESNRQYQKAFRSYKEGIRILLVGAKDDKDLKRKRLVKSKLDRYLDKAEFLYENYLTLNPNPSSMQDLNQRDSVSPIPGFNPEKLWQSALHGDLSRPMHFENIKSSPISELKEFKLVRIISKQVYLVVNIKSPLKPKCCAIKILLKSSDPLYPNKPTIIPNSVPFMVKFLQWFETEHSYILVMQYAGGGQLFDFVKLYQTKPVAVIFPQSYDTSTCDDTGVTLDESGTTQFTATEEDQREQAKLTGDMESVLDALAQLGSTKENCESYSRLFEEYTETVQPDDRTQLATYSKAKHSANQSLSCENEGPEKETCETKSRHSVPFEELQFQRKNFVGEQSTKEFEFSSSSSEVNTLKGEDATMKLIESSKVLLQTVNRTLAEVKSKSNDNINRCDDEPEHGFSNENNNSSMGIGKKKRVKSCGNSKCGNKSELEEEDEGIQSACEGSDADKELEVENTSSDPIHPMKSADMALDSNPGDSKAPVCSDSGEELELDDSPPQRTVPECCIKIWAAEIVLALEKLHSCGLSFGDLEMKNVLLGENGHILLSLGSQWSGVDQSPEIPSRKYEEFLAPEIRNSLGSPKWKIHPSSDFWSLGVILFELITGQKLGAVHPEGFHHPDTVIRIPDKNLVGDLISHNGRTLLTELLQYTPSLRLGFYGAAEVKSHPFFDGFDWESALEAADTINE